MTVYVDSAFIPYRRMKMSHMLADTVAELHEMASQIGMRRTWFQPISYPHYDVCISRRANAIELGAVVLDRRELGDLLKRCRQSWVEEILAERRGAARAHCPSLGCNGLPAE